MKYNFCNRVYQFDHIRQDTNRIQSVKRTDRALYSACFQGHAISIDRGGGAIKLSLSPLDVTLGKNLSTSIR